jgi:predicted Zn finger-like uncharacterized protein
MAFHAVKETRRWRDVPAQPAAETNHRGKVPVMIVTCPSCATTYDLPPETAFDQGAMIRCTACGHSWLEATALEAEDMDRIAGDIHLADTANMLEAEAARLAAEALAAEKARRARRNRRFAETRRWAMLAAGLSAIAAVLWAFPDQVTHFAPGMGRVYSALGVKANPQGFNISGVETSQTLTTSGQVVLAVTGRVDNISRLPRKAPGLVFILRDEAGRKVHEWKLPSVSARLVPAGRHAAFITRVAAPPRQARRVEVRLASAS